MHPIAFHLGRFPIHWYGVMVALGFMAGLWTASRRGLREGVAAEKVLDLGPWLILGAIAGAIVGSARPLPPPKQERYENAPEKPSPQVAAIFWALSGLVSLGVLGYFAVSGGAGPGDNLLGAGLILLVVGIPGAFLAAALVTAIVIPLAYQDVGLAFRRLGYIFGLALAGSALGTGVMVLVGFVLDL